MNNRTGQYRIRVWLIRAMPLFFAAAAVFVLNYLIGASRLPDVEPRLPGADNAPPAGRSSGEIKIEGTLEQAGGEPSDLPGEWPWFRGPARDNIAEDAEITLIENWPQQGPETLWSMQVGEGYAGAAVLNGMGYIIDYDRDSQRDVIRCISLESGNDIWRYSYPVKIKRNHGMSRTVPAVTDDWVVTIGPKCHVTCLDAKTGQFNWMLNLPAEYGTDVPPWYAGQCPLIEDGNVIIAPAGTEQMMIAVDCQTGRTVWQCPNTQGWSMTHSSIMPADFLDTKMYIYCAGGGIVGVRASDGELLWQSDEWRIRIANIPSPVILDENRLFLSGGYNRGSMMMRLSEEQNQDIEAQVQYELKPNRFGSDQQTPIFYKGSIYGVRPDGRLVCMDTEGNIIWTSGQQHKFGLGPYIIVNGMIYVMNDTGVLSMVRSQSTVFELVGQAKVLDGHDSWGPVTYFAGRLILRDLTTIKCIKIGE